jgi:uncharacterized protein affecting Mg2+/Co2+ transport
MNADVCYMVASFSNDRRSFACVSRSWHSSFSGSDAIWRACLKGDYSMDRIAPSNNKAADANLLKTYSTYKQAWRAWRQYEFEKVPKGKICFGNIWYRGLAAWDAIIQETRRLGVIEGLKLQKGVKNPIELCKKVRMKWLLTDRRLVEAVSVLWGTYDGQHTSIGLFGLTAFYHNRRSLRMLPLQVLLTQSASMPGLVICQCSNTGELMYLKENRIIGEQNGTPAFISEPYDDCLIQFFESYAKDLMLYSRTVLSLQTTVRGNGYLSSFPARGPRTSSTISHGIKVTGAYVMIPAENPQETLWVYQFCLETVKESSPGYVSADKRKWKKRAVLLRRHWTFMDPALDSPTIMEGDGVIGFNPCFDDQHRHRKYDFDDWAPNPFEYRSCMHASPGSYMEGYFTFAPETEDNQIDKSNTFSVHVARLSFEPNKFAW